MLLGERGAMQLDSVDAEAGGNNVLKHTTLVRLLNVVYAVT